MTGVVVQPPPGPRTLIDALLEEQRDLTAAERFARWHDEAAPTKISSHRLLVPLTRPAPGQQYSFEVDLDRCSGCKSCVTSCHTLNGLDDEETWRSTGLLHSDGRHSFQQTVTTACHHCVEPGCLEGCPVLAYDKDPVTGIVRHLDDQCIGCQYCIFMCPYEVPKYSARRGIVRKCDMCQQRLAHQEAPACVQACPNEAIRITVVDQESIRLTYRPGESSSDVSDNRLLLGDLNPFLPDSPDPALTLPTTRYVSAKPLASGLLAGDSQQISLQPAHVPLVVMLVLTQLGAGGFAMLPFVSPPTRPALALLACPIVILGLATSVLHLGKPTKAWRAFLGLRHSWLSREIVLFGVFMCLSIATVVGLNIDGNHTPLLWWPTSIVGLSGVFCSGMAYHVTGRECWRGEFSLGRFFGTTLVLGAAITWMAAAWTSTAHGLSQVLLALSTTVKLGLEFKQLRLCPDDAGLNEELPDHLPARGAFVMRFRLGTWLRARIGCACLGGIIMPLLGLVLVSAPLLLAATSLLLSLTGELLERLLFFRAVAVRKMPGVPHL